MIDWLKHKRKFFSISLAVIVVSIVSLFVWGINLSVDFLGGTIIEYKFEEQISSEVLISEAGNSGLLINSIQEVGDKKYLLKLPPVGEEQKQILAEVLEELTKGAGAEELRFETVGPSIGPELIKKTIYAVILAALAILIWIAYQFKNIRYGACAIMAMLHDSFILIGSFSLLGGLFGAEVDFLFVTALLTTLSFSVHDTIVVFDRIREIGGKNIEDWDDVANQALTETMVRSLNNSFTILFMLLALVLLGGATVKWFAIALLIGTILGTYSSPFVAVPLLVSWDHLFKRPLHLLGKY